MPKRPTVDKNGGLVFPGGQTQQQQNAAAAAAAAAYPYHLLAAGGLQGYVPAVSCELPQQPHLFGPQSTTVFPPHHLPHHHHHFLPAVPTQPQSQPHLYVDCSVYQQQ